MRFLVRLTALVVVVAVAVAAALWFWQGKAPAIAAVSPPDPSGFDAELVETGRQLAAVGDCHVCHTASGGADYAGGLGLETPFGMVYSTNITPDADTGIGTWSEAAFVRSMREGVDRDGNHLYPVFPYDHFTRVTDGDLSALYAYLMSQPAQAAPPHENELRFPFSLRPLLAGWKFLYLDRGVFEPDPALDDEQNRGKYLVEGLGHCGACHTPRTRLGGIDAARAFGGGEAEGWHVPPIGAASHAPVPWTLDAYANYLFDGWDEGHGIAAGPMTGVIDALYDANEDDVFAMAAYLATLTPEPDPAAVKAAIDAAAALDWSESEKPGGANAPTDETLLRGEAVFAAQCTRCHKTRIAETQPASLALTPAVNAPDPRNFAHVVMHGIDPPRASLNRKMESPGMNVSEADLADLAAFVRWRFTDLPDWGPLPAAP